MILNVHDGYDEISPTFPRIDRLFPEIATV